MRKIADKLKEYQAENIVVDPVMVATSGAKLISDEAIGTLKKRLLPIASVLTPNIPEAEVLAEMEIHSADDMIEAAKKISDTYHCAVLCKGGHKLNDANDLLYRDGGIVGSTENVLIIRIRMELVAHFPVPLRRTLQKDLIWTHP